MSRDVRDPGLVNIIDIQGSVSYLMIFVINIDNDKYHGYLEKKSARHRTLLTVHTARPLLARRARHPARGPSAPSHAPLFEFLSSSAGVPAAARGPAPAQTVFFGPISSADIFRSRARYHIRDDKG